MYHIHNKGSHYEMGFTWGRRLHAFGICLLDNIPFEITEEYRSFSHACRPFYQKYFPQILEEIHGIAQGNQCSETDLEAVLFGMYCIMPSTHCSCMALRNEHGVWFGRNSDFLTCIEKLYMNTIYRFSDDRYDFTGNTTAFVEMEDGVNEHGLTIGLTSVYPKAIYPGLNAGMLLRLMLETCKTIDDAIQLLKHVEIASSQTFTLMDASGDIACIECCNDAMHIDRPQGEVAAVCATNRFHSEEMRAYRIDIEDDWFAKERYETMRVKLTEDVADMQMADIQRLLSGDYGFLCQYDRTTGKDTVWSCIIDRRDYSQYRVEGNPARKTFKKDERFKVKPAFEKAV